MSAPKPTAEQHTTIQLLHKKCKLGVYEIMAIAEIATFKSRADYDRYIRMLVCYQIFQRLEMTSSEQTSLIRECGGSELWTLPAKRLARLHEKLTVRLKDVIHEERLQEGKYMVQTLRMDTCESVSDQKIAMDLAGRYEPGTVKAVFENGVMVGLFANGVRLEVTKMDMSY